MKTLIKSLVVAFISVAALSPLHAQELIRNGSFELPGESVFGSFYPLTSGSTVISNWTVGIVGNAEVIRTPNPWSASDGVYCLDLNGTQPGSVSQEVGLTSGQAYQLAFDMAYNPGTGLPASLRLTIGFSGPPSVISQDFVRPAGSQVPFWQRQTYDFVSPGTGPAKFTFADTSGHFLGGASLDNVSLVVVPEPSTWALLLTGGAATLFIRRGNRKR